MVRVFIKCAEVFICVQRPSHDSLGRFGDLVSETSEGYVGRPGRGLCWPPFWSSSFFPGGGGLGRVLRRSYAASWPGG